MLGCLGAVCGAHWACVFPAHWARAHGCRRYGAKGDGHTDDTAAVRAAFAAAATAGPSTVLFPGGKTFLTGAFNLSSHLVMQVAGTVLAWPGSDGGHYVLQPEVPWFGPPETLIWQARGS